MAKVKKEEKKASKPVLVKALKKGFDGVQIRMPGEVFPFDAKGEELGSWMEEVEGADLKAAAKKHKELAEAGAEFDLEVSQNDANAKAAQKHKEPDVVI